MLRSAGYRVSTAENGEEALDVLVQNERTPSVILLDLVMPRMDGWRFREIQRHHSKLWHIPVVIITEAPINEEYTSALGASSILVKPFDRSELLKVIGHSCGSSRKRNFKESDCPTSR